MRLQDGIFQGKLPKYIVAYLENLKNSIPGVLRDECFDSIFREKSGLHCLVLQSWWRLVRYHLGTVAFGSFIIALIQFIRMIMHYIEKKLKKHGGDNKMCEIFLKVNQ